MTRVAMRARSSRLSRGAAAAAREAGDAEEEGDGAPGVAAPAPSLLSMGRSRGSPARKMITAKTMPTAAIQNERL